MNTVPDSYSTVSQDEATSQSGKYKIVGDLASSAHPFIVLYGGPGVSQEYTTPLGEIHNKCNIPVILYDQIGIGKSIIEGVAKKPKEFWIVDLFIDELDNLLVHLGVQSGFALLGDSWGAMLGTHYASHRHSVGPSEFTIAGTLKSWSCLNQIYTIIVNGIIDEAQDVCVSPFFHRIPWRRTRRDTFKWWLNSSNPVQYN
ncbi:hypothetical protein F4604DRAFT_1685754 [Suillus subluteus]|nr:hypothetical protein F4604DRAFT_1685754 [Suillus subluteus]